MPLPLSIKRLMTLLITGLIILIAGHIVVPLLLLVEQTWHPAMALQMVVWPAVTLALMLLVLPRCKGAVLGLLWATRAGAREEPLDGC